jgi:hypothetical protein
MIADLLKTLSPEQLDALSDLINTRRMEGSSKKIDYTRMTDRERWEANKTLQPVTPMVPYQEYPCMLYGRRDGQLVSIAVDDAAHEEAIREKFDYGWKRSIAEHGIETCPSSGDGINPVSIQQVSGVPDLPPGLAPADFAAGLIRSQEKNKGGRPRKMT